MIDGFYKFIGKKPPLKDLSGNKIYKVEQQGMMNNGIVAIITSYPLQRRFVYRDKRHFSENWRFING